MSTKLFQVKQALKILSDTLYLFNWNVASNTNNPHQPLTVTS